MYCVGAICPLCAIRGEPNHAPVLPPEKSFCIYIALLSYFYPRKVIFCLCSAGWGSSNAGYMVKKFKTIKRWNATFTFSFTEFCLNQKILKMGTMTKNPIFLTFSAFLLFGGVISRCPFFMRIVFANLDRSNHPPVIQHFFGFFLIFIYLSILALIWIFGE